MTVLALSAIGLAGGWWAWPTQVDPDVLWRQAQTAFREGRRAESKATLRAIGRLRKKTPLDWVLQAQIDAAEGRAGAALSALERVPEGDPIYAQSALMASRLERERKRLRAAEGHLKRSLAADPKLVEAHRELIYIYGIQSRRREADAEFRALGKLAPLTHKELYTWALTHFAVWNPDVARQLQEFIDADPDDRDSRLALAEALIDQPGQGPRVISTLTPFPSSDPDALDLRVGLAIREGRLDEARSLLDQGPADHPGLARYRGRLAMAARDPVAAVRFYRLALSAEAFDRKSATELAQALTLTGDTAEAGRYQARAKRLNDLYNLLSHIRSPDREDRASDLSAFGAACEAAGLPEEARHWYELAVTRDPLDTTAQKKLFHLKSADP